MNNASGSKEWSAADKVVVHAHVCTHKPLCRNGRARLDARVGIWQLCELCLGLTKQCRPDKVWHADKFLLRRHNLWGMRWMWHNIYQEPMHPSSLVMR